MEILLPIFDIFIPTEISDFIPAANSRAGIKVEISGKWIENTVSVPPIRLSVKLE